MRILKIFQSNNKNLIPYLIFEKLKNNFNSFFIYKIYRVHYFSMQNANIGIVAKPITLNPCFELNVKLFPNRSI